MVEVQVVFLDEELALPTYARPGDAGADLIARHEIRLEPHGGRGLVATGISIAIPNGYAGLILPRSGIAARNGITCLNAPGLIDSGFRGEVQVLLVNTDRDNAYQVHRGDRVAQLIVVPFEQAVFVPVDVLPESERGKGGFGHTGD